MVRQMLQNSTTCTFIFNKFHLCLKRYIYTFYTYLYSTIRIFFQLQPKLFSFSTNISSTSTKNNFIHQEYLFNFNQNYFHPTIIFVHLHQNYFHSTIIIIQLQQKLFSFNNYNYSTSNMHSELITWPCFYEKTFRKFLDIQNSQNFSGLFFSLCLV